MQKKKEKNFEKLLNVISSISTFKILQLYSQDNKGYSLTETSKKLNLSISTINDNIKKLVSFQFIYALEKKYYISAYGDYILNQMDKIRIFSQFELIFGKIIQNIIPNEFIENLFPFIEDVNVKTRTLNIILDMKKYIKIFKSNLQKLTTSSIFRTLGWWSDDVEFSLIRDEFPELNSDPVKIREIMSKINLKIITDRSFADKIISNNTIKTLEQYLDIHQSIRIVEEDIKFNFTIINLNEYMILFLIKDNDEIDIKHHLFIENKNINDFCDKIFNYYEKKSIPLREYLKKK